jgi:patatin-related protein
LPDSEERPWTADIRKEIRLAVVLYGGVSLAIYISGVVRELLAMVRATAPTAQPLGPAGSSSTMVEPNVSGSAAVYRRLAAALNAPLDATGPDVVYTRFVVDVISGTSAGGLNGIYLGKALAEGASLDGLRAFWLQYGDIAGLLDGENSAPRSLLSGDHMLTWLNKAFVDMQSLGAEPAQGLVDDVQCFATTTDLRGLPIYLRLSDQSVTEQRYRNVFRFAFSSGVWSTPRNDFHGNDSALSLAARCTSSFPGAFAPARVLDVGAQKLSILTDEQLRATFPDYRQPMATGSGDERFDPARHAFADGGILNNKPFSHAVGALGATRGGKPSERKLVYVEPSPELSSAPLPVTPDPSTPDFFKVLGSAFSLPSQQTIREDLQRVADRNRLIDRMNGVLADIPHEVRSHSRIVVATIKARLAAVPADGTGDAERARLTRLLRLASPSGPNASRDASDAFVSSDIDDMVTIYGLGYGGYHRIKVASVTDDLASLVAQLLSMPEGSDDWLAVRMLVGTWRDLTYAPYSAANQTVAEAARAEHMRTLVPAEATALGERLSKRASENAFLVHFDPRFGLRRLDFLLNKIDDLFCMDERAALLLRSFGVVDPSTWMSRTRREQLGKLARGLGAIYMMLRSRLDSLGDPSAPRFDSAEWERRLAESTGVAPAAVPARTESNAPETLTDLASAVGRLGITATARRALLASSPDAQARDAVKMVAASIDHFDAAAAELSRQVQEASLFARRWANAILPVSPLIDRSTLEEPGDIIRFLYDHFESVDRITFPVFYQTDVGHEVDTVALVRVSPDDSVAITKGPRGTPVHKLGGERLGHFGGFFAREWRASDFLWGQLDGAERMITAVAEAELGAERVKVFVAEAQTAILDDDRNVEGLPALAKLKTGAERLAFLKSNWKDLIAAPPELQGSFGTAISGSLPILGTIFRLGGAGPFGALATRIGEPALFLVQSTFDNGRRFVFLLVSAALLLAGALSGYSAIASVTPFPHLRHGLLRAFSVGGGLVGGLLLIAVAAGLLYGWFRLKRALDKLRSSASGESA